jgi:7-cyano-7-deazaguanine synthase
MCEKANRPVVVLLSGGLDSATALGVARAEGRQCWCLTIDYGQRHALEIDAARAIAREMSRAHPSGGRAVDHRVVRLDLREIGGSALTADIDVPKDRFGAHGETRDPESIPATYVPARNMTFLSIATGYAEMAEASEIYIGANAVDYSGYPDCREEFLRSFERTATLGTKRGVEGHAVRIEAPLVKLTKAEIIRLGVRCGVRFELTHSCYDPDAEGNACGRCDSCVIRRRGFLEAGVSDPTRYAPGAPLMTERP